ncbi:MAG TPA: hypothetical protein VFQ72_04060 [Candidatus Paceibacterota bacterium]|nr:hypothetical protein [Candidatus Paceibacterota bacterium]
MLQTYRLEGKARAMVDSYLALPLGTKPSCPYFNNRRRRSRSQLRVLRGKGSPAEIAEEAAIEALHARVDANALSTDKLKEFIVSRDLGVDCSGFAYHVLNALCQEKRGKSIQSFMKSNRAGFVGSLVARLRPAENLGVSSFANERNSSPILASQALPGDVVTLIGTGRDGQYNHILVITGVERLESDTRLSYAHSYAWPSDGLYGHGVREGDILVHGPGDAADLLAGTWKEQGKVGADNYTHESAKAAKEVSIRRLGFNA